MPVSPEPRTRVLILGGSGEAARLAARLAEDARFETLVSLAGVTRRPVPLPVPVVSGGFGGAEGLARFLAEEGIVRVVDATHPFAARMSANAAAACLRAGVPLVRLSRPPWRAAAGDTWIEVADAAVAAAEVRELGERVFLSLGRKELGAFSGLPGIWFLVRLIEAPAAPLPLARYDLVRGRGPFRVEDEIALLKEHRIQALVSKNSGGAATYAKIEAARRLELPVVMLRPPPAPVDVDQVTDVEGALKWLGL